MKQYRAVLALASLILIAGCSVPMIEDDSNQGPPPDAEVTANDSIDFLNTPVPTGETKPSIFVDAPRANAPEWNKPDSIGNEILLHHEIRVRDAGSFRGTTNSNAVNDTSPYYDDSSYFAVNFDDQRAHKSKYQTQFGKEVLSRFRYSDSNRTLVWDTNGTRSLYLPNRTSASEKDVRTGTPPYKNSVAPVSSKNIFLETPTLLPNPEEMVYEYNNTNERFGESLRVYEFKASEEQLEPFSDEESGVDEYKIQLEIDDDGIVRYVYAKVILVSGTNSSPEGVSVEVSSQTWEIHKVGDVEAQEPRWIPKEK